MKDESSRTPPVRRAIQVDAETHEAVWEFARKGETMGAAVRRAIALARAYEAEVAAGNVTAPVTGRGDPDSFQSAPA